MARRVPLLVGTRKGTFILESGPDRRTWSGRGPSCDGWPINDISRDPATGTLYAGGSSPWYGPTVFRSDDLGATWQQSSAGSPTRISAGTGSHAATTQSATPATSPSRSRPLASR